MTDSLPTLAGVAVALIAATGAIAQAVVTRRKAPVDRDSIVVTAARESVDTARSVRDMVRAELEAVRAEVAELRTRLGHLERRMSGMVLSLQVLAARYATAPGPLAGAVVAQDIHAVIDQHTD